MRTWTGSRDRTLRAVYEEISEKNVLLRLENGKQIPFPIAKLATPEQDWLREQWNKSPKAIASRIDQFILPGLEEAERPPNPKTSDTQFVRRVYLEIMGAIPTYDQTVTFLKSNETDNRTTLMFNTETGTPTSIISVPFPNSLPISIPGSAHCWRNFLYPSRIDSARVFVLRYLRSLLQKTPNLLTFGRAEPEISANSTIEPEPAHQDHSK